MIYDCDANHSRPSRNVKTDHKKKAEIQIGDWSPQDETDVANRGSEPPKSATDAVNLDRSLKNDQCQDCKNDTRPSLQYPTTCNVVSSNKCLDNRPPFQNPHARIDHIKPRRPWKSNQKPVSGHAWMDCHFVTSPRYWGNECLVGRGTSCKALL